MVWMLLYLFIGIWGGSVLIAVSMWGFIKMSDARKIKASAQIPRAGDVDAARKWPKANRASGDDWEALEDAETK